MTPKDYNTFGKLICQLYVFIMLYKCIKHKVIDVSSVKMTFI